MQQDPVFKEMVSRSFLLQKEKDLEIPMVKKVPGIKEHGATTLVLSTAIHMLIYPLDTIKTRVIANHKYMDIAKFNANKVSELTTYLGLFRGYSSLLIGNLCHLTIGKDSLFLASVLQGLLKTWIDQTKISKQMGNNSADVSLMKKTFGICAIYGVMRDLSFRTLYFKISEDLHKKAMAHVRTYDDGKRINNLFLATIIATIISQPFQVCFVKAASQRSLHYSNLVQIPLQIMKEQGKGKLFMGGLWARLTYNIISTLLLSKSYDKTLEAFNEAL